MNTVDRIDAVLDGKCPCGADPRPGSAYCGYDCEPTHLTADTGADEAKPWTDPWADVMPA